MAVGLSRLAEVLSYSMMNTGAEGSGLARGLRQCPGLTQEKSAARIGDVFPTAQGWEDRHLRHANAGMAGLLPDTPLNPEQRRFADIVRTSAEAAPIAPIFDRTAFMSRMMDDKELARMVIEGFLEDLPVQIQALQGEVRSRAIGGVQQLAHKIKGASGAVGGEALRAVASAMEQAAKAGDWTRVLARMLELEDQFAGLKRVLERTIHEQRQPARE